MKRCLDSCIQDKIYSIGLDKFQLLDSYMINAQEKEIEYLLSLSPEKLLAGFYETAGLKPQDAKYGSWENSEIRGHTMGHYLKAMAQAATVKKSSVIIEKLDKAVKGLAECQREDGYLSAFPEEFFDRVENKQPVWVPWYTMHKILAGLTAAIEYTENEQALSVASKLADWVANRAAGWNADMRKQVLSVEYGGMNDCLYQLYKFTGKENHLKAAQAFDEDWLFEPIHEGIDTLPGRHANTTIPKFVGALNRYAVTGEKFYLETCISFWNMVVNHHSYVTGGNSEWEHFGKPDILNAKRTNCTCETCNTYNMQKLTAMLYQFTGDKKYMDFYEGTFWNAILPSQNPETAMTMYFQPMAAGYFKVYGTPYNSFWCCTGTGMENFTKLGIHTYFYTGNALIINQYISSAASIDKLGLQIKQTVNFIESGDITVTIEGADCEREIELRLRVPEWVKGTPTAELNGKSIEGIIEDGYFHIKRQWVKNDKLTVTLPMAITIQRLPDDANTVAFRYGPLVLCAGMGTEDMQSATTGVDVSIPVASKTAKDYIVVQDGDIEGWLANISAHVVRTADGHFTLQGTDEDNQLQFKPYFMEHEQRYGIYFTLVAPNSPELYYHISKETNQKNLERNTVDLIPIGNDQYELEHKIEALHTEVGTLEDLRYRKIEKDGFISYHVRVRKDASNYLLLTFHSKFRREILSIYANGILVTNETVKPLEPFDFYKISIQLPVCKEEEIELRFAADHDNFSGLFDTIRVLSYDKAQSN